MPANKPTSLTVRTYQVGFGDCFLLSFNYADRDRHVLVDFGTMRLPSGVGGTDQYMIRVANQIKTDCGGKLDAVVATHRHQDHISGFKRTAGKGPGQVIRDLSPEVVVQPWTEDPNAETKATEPTEVEQAKSFLQSFDHMHRVALRVVDEARKYHTTAFSGIGAQLAVIGMDNIKNPEAVENLRTMALKKNTYVHHGSRSGLETVLPGVVTHVLGPPTLKQTSSILRQRSSAPDEFWQLHAGFWQRQALTAAMGEPGRALRFRRGRPVAVPPEARWFRAALRHSRSESLLSIVRLLDDAMNNTSVILLFEIGSTLILFPGDAQYENWMYALSDEATRQKLRGVRVYKVGHHGSRNATPRTLWAGFDKAKTSAGAQQLVAFLSTLEDVHGTAAARSEVPRSTLLAALRQGAKLTNTQDFAANEIRVPVTIPL